MRICCLPAAFIFGTYLGESTTWTPLCCLATQGTAEHSQNSQRHMHALHSGSKRTLPLLFTRSRTNSARHCQLFLPFTENATLRSGLPHPRPPVVARPPVYNPGRLHQLLLHSSTTRTGEPSSIPLHTEVPFDWQLLVSTVTEH